MKIIAAAAVILASTMPQAKAQTPIPVTVDNFVRAETDMYFSNAVRDGGFGKFHHNRQPLPLDQQTVIRTNRDTLYSSCVFDLEAGPVAITLPDAGKRFMSLQIITEDQYTVTGYGAGPHALDKAKLGTRYAMAAIRTLYNPKDPYDLKQAHALQDAITVSQPGGPGKFEIPDWDKVSQKKVRDALLVLASTAGDWQRSFGTKETVDPVHYLIGAAAGWGANAPQDAMYFSITPDKNDGRTAYTLNIRDVPVDGFWSISVYNAEGYYEKNALDAYALNNITAKKENDGSIAVQFGNCSEKVSNCLPIMNGWNYTVRLYRPRPEVLNGTWKFPEPKPLG